MDGLDMSQFTPEKMQRDHVASLSRQCNRHYQDCVALFAENKKLITQSKELLARFDRALKASPLLGGT